MISNIVDDVDELSKGDKEFFTLPPSSNEVYFYKDINNESIILLNKELSIAAKNCKILAVNYDLLEPPPVHLHICSDGGDVSSAAAAVDRLKTYGVPIYTYAEGMVASAASLIFVSGNKRFIYENSMILIHQIRIEFWGNYSEFQDETHNSKLIMDLVRNIYLKNTKLTLNELNELLKHDLYLSAKDCIERGVADTMK